jgi:nicotinamidase-related amidase
VSGLRLLRGALVTIDTQADTLDGQPLEVAGTSAVVPNIGRLGQAFRGAGRPIVHVVRLYRADGSNAEPIRRQLVRGATPVLRPATPGRLLAPGLLAAGSGDLDDDLLLAGGIQSLGENEVAIYKPRWGAFFGTPLEAHLRDLHVDTLVFAGCNFPNCPRTSVYEASERDFRIALVDDAVSGLYDRGRDEMRAIGVSLPTTDEIVAAGRQRTSSSPTSIVRPGTRSVTSRSPASRTTGLA